VNRLTTEGSLTPLNRKYLGSKRLLRAWIADRIVTAAGVPESFLDGFCGTGAVTLPAPRASSSRRSASSCSRAGRGG
jgi:hypothetical protein